MPAWVWWLLVLIAIGAAVAIPQVVRARRRSAWRAELAASEEEVAWFARVLVPELRDAGTRDAVAGGWTIGGEARVSAVEDQLTVLESSAPDPPAGERARALRDAVRSSRARLQTMVDTGTEETIRRDLDQIAVELEAALPPAQPQPPD